jgi:hypothetical protein
MEQMRVRLAGAVLALLVFGAAAAPAGVSAANSLKLSATYDVSARIGWAAGTFDVRSTARVTNSSGDAVDELSFNLLPAKIGRMTLTEVLVDGQSASAAVEGQTVTVGVPGGLRADAEASIVIAYRALFNTTTSDKDWMLAKLNKTITAYRWIPWLSRATKFNRPNFGDPFVTATSKEVRVTLTSDKALKLATSGKRVSTSGNNQTFVATKVRDFNFAASPKYSVAKGSKNGIKIRIMHRGLPAATMLKWAKKSLNRFAAQIGPYPYSHFFVAQTEGGSGMESPGMIWIPRSTSSSNLTYLIAHETAHQWFYAVLGSDQAKEPFADEGPADFLARDLVQKRRSPKCVLDTLDKTVYDYSSSCYYETIYIRGGNYLHEYRLRVGDEAFWAGMRAYYEEYRFRLGGTPELLAMLDAAAGQSGGGHQSLFPKYFD